ncbi:MAG: hypothetical protein J4415_02385 [Candidatus Diapherotrites archaeon]|uniref:Uncharacterized protein n=1 Tax=Candidatus Iainarchaeum sp. TaxID=3101447 RepID=A0A8T4KR05_9ARCH|nr:hypothetical protein [Candidatus Diapherotrites archaeon]
MAEENRKRLYEDLFEEPNYLGAVNGEEELKFAEPTYMREWEEEAPKGSFFEKFDSIRRFVLENRGHFFIVFAGIYLAYAAIIFYLLYFNGGIAIDASIGENGDAVIVAVKNESSRMIKDIRIELLVGDEVENSKVLSALRSGREAILNFPLETAAGKDIIVSASAPFHLPVKRILEPGKTQRIKIRSTLKLSREKIFADQNLWITLELCNLGQSFDNMSIIFRYDEIFDSESAKVANIPLSENECRELPYVIHALGIGKGNIYFNISAYDYSDKIEKEIEVVK